MKFGMRCLCASMGWLASIPLAQATVCTASTTSVNFGSYDSFDSGATLSTGTVSVICDVVATYSIGITAGIAGSFVRAMASGAHRLNYNLYTDSTRAVVWGDGSSGSARIGSSGTTGAVHTVYGRIPALQRVPAGSYADLLTVTVEF
jgi:spore coat protein U-like protein